MLLNSPALYETRAAACFATLSICPSDRLTRKPSDRFRNFSLPPFHLILAHSNDFIRFFISFLIPPPPALLIYVGAVPCEQLGALVSKVCSEVLVELREYPPSDLFSRQGLDLCAPCLFGVYFQRLR